MKSIEEFLEPVSQLHGRIRDAVVRACEESDTGEMSGIAKEEEGDTIYAIDRVSEELLLDFFREQVTASDPMVLIAEGITGGQIVLPESASEKDARWRIIMDPIDGTRGIMYQKRSAWILTGVAPNTGSDTSLQDIEFAIQTEIPTVKQHLSDIVWAFRGQGVHAERYNRLTGDRSALELVPSSARTIAHGFAMISRFFPGAREVLAEIDEEVVREALGPVEPGKAHCFEDQYVCTGGQLYELMAGHDRFNADLRPLMEKVLARRGAMLGICCHPYDICTELIARELGVLITDEFGESLDAPLRVDADLSWIGYANRHIRQQIEPLLYEALAKRELL